MGDHRLPSQTTGATNITSNHDVTTAGKSAEDMPDTYSLVDTTEKVVDAQMVDENLPTSQRNTDLQSTNISQREANAPLRNEMDHENELLCD